jgi:hypothetical protein
MNRKSQEEIVGFIFIVAIVVVAGLIFLSFSLRGNKITGSSSEVESFMSALVQYSTNCSMQGTLDIGDLMKSCYLGKSCEQGENACSELNRTLQDIMKNSWDIGDENKNKGYNILFYYQALEEKEKIIEFSEGNCNKTIRRGASQAVHVSSGDLFIEISICS